MFNEIKIKRPDKLNFYPSYYKNVWKIKLQRRQDGWDNDTSREESTSGQGVYKAFACFASKLELTRQAMYEPRKTNKTIYHSSKFSLHINKYFKFFIAVNDLCRIQDHRTCPRKYSYPTLSLSL